MSTATVIPTYLETGDVALRLGVSAKTVLVWEREGKIKPAGVTSQGTRLRDADHVEALCRERAGTNDHELAVAR